MASALEPSAGLKVPRSVPRLLWLEWRTQLLCGFLEPISVALPLTDRQSTLIVLAVEPLHHRDRAAYLRRVAELLAAHPVIGNGLVARVTRGAQKEFLPTAPVVEPPDL